MNVQSATINGVRVNVKERVRIESFGFDTTLKPGVYRIFGLNQQGKDVFVAAHKCERGRPGFGNWVNPDFKIRPLKGRK